MLNEAVHVLSVDKRYIYSLKNIRLHHSSINECNQEIFFVVDVFSFRNRSACCQDQNCLSFIYIFLWINF